MNKNSDFSTNQVNLTLSRSVYDFHPKCLGTCNAGVLVPVWTYTDVMPGDTFNISFNALIRSTTPVCPVMDDLYCDVGFFWVPNRILLSRETYTNDQSTVSALRSWKYFLGAQDNLLNMPLPASEDDRTLPCLYLSDESKVGFLWDYTGNALAYGGLGDLGDYPVNPFWALSYYAVWNDFYRDPNLMEPVTWYVEDVSPGAPTPSIHFNQNNYAGISTSTNVANDLGLACVSPFHGYFGSALPWPQRNAAGVPVGLLEGYAPIIAQGSLTNTYSNDGVHNVYPTLSTGQKTISNPTLFSYTGTTASNVGTLFAGQRSGYGAPDVTAGVEQWNLKADLSKVPMSNINELRLGFAQQRYYEALARSGNRYNEMMSGIYGVSRGPEDGVEFLGSQRIMLNMNQVNATSGGPDAPKLGSTGAFSLTSFSNKFTFKKSATEHGTIICVMAIRPQDTFSQGLPKMFQRYKFFDYYLPQFAHIGEQPIFSSELYLKGDMPVKESSDALVFGYQEYASEYRMMQNHVSGHLRPGQSMGYWTYANNFSDTPTLLDFMDGRRFKNNVDQTLQTSSQAAGGFQFMYDFGFNITAIRPIPTDSIPGLIDHH